MKNLVTGAKNRKTYTLAVTFLTQSSSNLVRRLIQVIAWMSLSQMKN
jgi:hypothetical protein